MKNMIVAEMEKSLAVKQALLKDDAAIGAMAAAVEKAIEVFRQGGKLLIAGNGGSAADSQHVAGELVNRLYFDRPALPAIALSTDTSVLTAIGNDSGFDLVFSRQVEALGADGDMFLGISTSGNAPNIINALRVCRQKGIFSVGLTGRSGGKLASLCDICIKVPADKTPRVQECHILICHIFCGIIEEKLFGK